MDTHMDTLSTSRPSARSGNTSRSATDITAALMRKRLEVTMRASALLKGYQERYGLPPESILAREMMSEDLRSRGIPFLDPFTARVVDMFRNAISKDYEAAIL